MRNFRADAMAKGYRATRPRLLRKTKAFHIYLLRVCFLIRIMLPIAF